MYIFYLSEPGGKPSLRLFGRITLVSGLTNHLLKYEGVGTSTFRRGGVTKFKSDEAVKLIM